MHGVKWNRARQHGAEQNSATHFSSSNFERAFEAPSGLEARSNTTRARIVPSRRQVASKWARTVHSRRSVSSKWARTVASRRQWGLEVGSSSGLEAPSGLEVGSSLLLAHWAPRGHCSSLLRAPIGASRPLFEPTSSSLSASNVLFEPTSRPLGASKALFEPASCSSVLQGHLAPRKHVRNYCSKNAWHCSAPLRAALLCSTLLRAWICTGSH